MNIIELADCTNVLLREIADPSTVKIEVAKTYHLAMRSSENTDWKIVNQLIVERWSKSGLKAIKNMAWSGKCFE